MAKKLWIENIENPSVLFQESEPVGFTDYTNDAVMWDKYGHYVMDYLFYRDRINTILFILANPNYPTIDFSGWGSLTAEQKEIMARYILAPYALRLTIYSDELDYKNWDELLRITQGTEPQEYPYTGRSLLIEKMRRFVAHEVRKEQLSMASSQLFFKDVAEIVDWYIRAACPDFKQWITNEVGSPYESDGFAQAAYYSESLRDELMNIYNTGE